MMHLPILIFFVPSSVALFVCGILRTEPTVPMLLEANIDAIYTIHCRRPVTYSDRPQPIAFTRGHRDNATMTNPCLNDASRQRQVMAPEQDVGQLGSLSHAWNH